LGRLQRGWRWFRRNPAIASLSGLAAGLLLIGSVVSTYYAVEASRKGAIATEKAAEAISKGRLAEDRAAEALAAKQVAEQESDRAEYQLYGNFIKLAQQELDQNNIPQVDRYLEACPQRMRNFEWYYLRRAGRGYASQFDEQSLTLSSLAVSPDGKLSAIGGPDRAVKIWKTATGELVRTLRGHRANVAGLAFSPDGKRLASASWDRTVRVWELESGRSLHTYTRHSDQVHCVAFSPDGEWIGSGGRDKSLQLWDAEDFTPVHVLREHEGVVSAIAFEPVGATLIASGSSDGTVRIWNVETGKQERVLKGHTHFVNSVDFSPDGKLIASSCLDNPVYIWNAHSGEKLKELGVESKNSASIRFNLTGNRLATCNNDGRIRIWSFSLHPRATLAELFSIPRHHDGSCLLEFAPSLGGRLVSAGSDGFARVWDLKRPPSFIPLESVVGHESVAFDSSGQNLLLADSESPFSNSWEKDRVSDLSMHRLQDLNQSTTLGTFRGWITSLAGGEGGLIAVGSTESEQKHCRLTVFRLDEPKPVMEQLELPGVVTRLKFSADGGKLVSAILRPDREHEVWLWDTNQGKSVLRISVLRMLGHRGTGSMTDISPDGTRILSGYFFSGRERIVSMWDATNGKSMLQLKTHAAITVTRFSPDGRHIAAAGMEQRGDVKRLEHTIKIIDADSGELERTLEGHGDTIRAVAYSPDGSRLASKDNIGVIKIWDLKTGQQMLSLKSRDLTSLLAFSADGRRLLSSGGTNSRIWDGTEQSSALTTQKLSYPLLEIARLDAKTAAATPPPIVENPLGGRMTFAGKQDSHWLRLLRQPPEQLDWEQRRPLEDGGRDAIPIVMQALKSDDNNMRQNALQILRFPSPKNEYMLQDVELALIRRLTEDDNDLTRVSAIQTLWFWTSKSGGAPTGIDELIKLSSSKDPAVAGWALNGLSQMLSAALPTTKAALKSDDDQIRAAIGKALQSLASRYMRAGAKLTLDGPALRCSRLERVPYCFLLVHVQFRSPL
jgi:WD40 repeat protein